MKQLIGMFILLFCSSVANAQFSGGNGTENSPYIITTAAELAQLATYVNAGNEDFNSGYYKLANNIDLSAYQSEEGWIPIGITDGAYNIHYFSGVFDGNNKKITGLKMNVTSQLCSGLFGYVRDGKIINLGVENAEVSVSYVAIRAGIVVGILANSIVSNCCSAGTISANSTYSNDAYAGGLAGVVGESSSVSNCFSTATVSLYSSYNVFAGSLIGNIDNSTVSNCYSAGAVNTYSTYNYATSGGVAGLSYYGSTLSNCYSIGKVSAKADNGVSIAGGVTGYLYGAQISNCVAINPIVICAGAYEYYGRVIGYNYGGNSSINLGFEDMYNSYGNEWYNIGESNLDGESISKTQIMADGTFGNRFSAANGWTTQNGKLPGFGTPVELPDFLTQPTVVNIKVTPTKTFMKQGTTQLFEANVFVFNNAPTSVTWSVIGGVSGTGITQNGLLTIANNETALSLTVMATSTFDNTIKGIANVWVSFIITTAEQLAQVATNVNSGNLDFTSGYFILGNDIDLSIYQGSSGWTPIGKDEKMFQGVFDGNNKKITGLKINTTAYDANVGLFGYVYNGTIKNLGIENADVYRGNTVNNNLSYVGIFAGCIDKGIVSNCYATGSVSSNSTGVSRTAYAGGLAGIIYGTTITNCYTEGDINASCIGYYAEAGGFVGEMQYSTISNCYSTAVVTANSSGNRLTIAGGVAGDLLHSTMSNCYSTATVSSSSTTSRVGGVVGDLYISTVLNCAALNPGISCKDQYGRVVGSFEGYGAGTPISNIAFADMLNPAGNTTWNNIGASNRDGETITCEEILADGTFGGRFISEGGWTTKNGKLPGLFGNTVDFPVHLCFSGYPPIITTTTLPDGIEGVEYNHTLDTWGNLPILWAIETGNLPDGLHIFDTGKISGSPTTEGTFNFIVKAMNDYGFDTKAFSITVKTCEAVNNLTSEKCSNNCVLLSWSEPESSLPVIEYHVYRRGEGNDRNYELRITNYERIDGEYELVGVTKGTTFLDENLPVGAYEYYVVTHYEMGCVSDSSNHVRERVELGVEGVKELEGVRVWPNPAFTTVTIEAEKFSRVEIYNVFGQLLNTSMEKIVDISTLNSGVYFLKIYTEKGMVVKKVIKN